MIKLYFTVVKDRKTKEEEWFDCTVQACAIRLKMMPFSARILMTDCGKHRITAKDPGNGREEKKTHWRKSERLVEKRGLKTTI